MANYHYSLFVGFLLGSFAGLLGGFSPVVKFVRNDPPRLLDLRRALEELAQYLPGLHDPRTLREVRGPIGGDANAPIII